MLLKKIIKVCYDMKVKNIYTNTFNQNQNNFDQNQNFIKNIVHDLYVLAQ